MSRKKYLKLFLGMLVGLGIAATAEAKVFFQCPTLTDPGDPTSVVYTGIYSDSNGDGQIRAEDGEIVNPVHPREVCVHLSSGDGFVNMADKTVEPAGHEQYVFGFKNITGVPDAQAMTAGLLGAQFPAPTLRFKEGDEVYLSLTNVGMAMRPDLFDPHTVHWHGFPNASTVFDGEPMASISINMGATLTYYYRVVEPGTFMYHCHVEATEHMQMGMLGNLFVRPAQDGTSYEYPPGSGRFFTQFAYNDGDGSTGYNVEKEIQILGFDRNFHDEHIAVQPLPFADMRDTYPMLNGRGYPDTVNPAVLANSFDGQLSQPVNSLITANQGDRILLHLSSLSTTSFHTLTVQGIPMQVVGQGSRQRRAFITTNTVTLGGGEAKDVILDTAGLDGLVGTADDVPAGTYYLYTTNLDHLANFEEDYGGMMTEIVIQ